MKYFEFNVLFCSFLESHEQGRSDFRETKPARTALRFYSFSLYLPVPLVTPNAGLLASISKRLPTCAPFG